MKTSIYILGVLGFGLILLQTGNLHAQNDPLIGSQWHHTNMNSSAAWGRQTDCRGTLVGVFDTGIRYSHDDLRSNMIGSSGLNFADGQHGSAVATDVQGHGTFVAGFIGAVGNNGIGVTGLCWQSAISAYKVLADNGSGNFSWAANAIYAAASAGIRVSNHSYGANLQSNPFAGQFWPSILITALQASGNSGAINVFAAGNNSVNLNGFVTAGGVTVTRVCGSGRSRCSNVRVTLPPVTPTIPTGVVVAAASQSDRSLASFSNYGGQVVHLSAPGRDVVSTSNASNTSYATMSGTSFASPIVAGAVALIWSRNPSWTASAVISELLNRHAPQPVITAVRSEWTIVGYDTEQKRVCVEQQRRGRSCQKWGYRQVQTARYGNADVSYTSNPQAGKVMSGELNLSGFR